MRKTATLVMILALAACGKAPETPVATADNSAAPASASADTGLAAVSEKPITKAQVDQLKEGMSYDEVKAIMGREGSKGATEGATAMYSWVNNSGGSLQSTFQDGKLTVWSDFGIK